MTKARYQEMLPDFLLVLLAILSIFNSSKNVLLNLEEVRSSVLAGAKIGDFSRQSKLFGDFFQKNRKFIHFGAKLNLF